MSSSISRLLTIMTQLRDPQSGCPWDSKQTFDSIVPYTLEETYEVLDAIRRKDFDDLRGELGDLLYQVVFYAQMAQEQGLFDFSDVCDAISDKLERRHPHIFAGADAPNAADALKSWEQTKSRERAEKALHSQVDDIPEALPALMQAQKIQQRCSAVGFDCKTLGPVVDKLYEEIDEVMFEAKQAVVDQERLGEELGDMFFAAVNLSRHLGHKAEITLQDANRKFCRRFRQVEQIISEKGKTLPEASLKEMEAAWQQVKCEEKRH
ncbi:nucleoside triphosphate pyrophosphohydrolase [Lonsdalea quercina]|uniref:nucleoside triphosphate pyrophosphohydrolase n=1 Tax=Lonsdalea quercina TaxID=71657 RepID=UPI00397505BD